MVFKIINYKNHDNNEFKSHVLNCVKAFGIDCMHIFNINFDSAFAKLIELKDHLYKVVLNSSHQKPLQKSCEKTSIYESRFLIINLSKLINFICTYPIPIMHT